MCRILAIAERQDRVLAALGAEPKFREATFGGPDVARPEAQPRFRGLAADLADQLRNREFVAESVDGVQARADLQQRETAIDEARPSRWIQASGWRPDAPKLSARSLAPCEWNLLTVHIGPSEAPRSDAPLPTSGLNFTHGDLPVTVQVELARPRVRPSLWGIKRGGTRLTDKCENRNRPNGARLHEGAGGVCGSVTTPGKAVGQCLPVDQGADVEC